MLLRSRRSAEFRSGSERFQFYIHRESRRRRPPGTHGSYHPQLSAEHALLPNAKSLTTTDRSTPPTSFPPPQCLPSFTFVPPSPSPFTLHIATHVFFLPSSSVLPSPASSSLHRPTPTSSSCLPLVPRSPLPFPPIILPHLSSCYLVYVPRLSAPPLSRQTYPNSRPSSVLSTPLDPSLQSLTQRPFVYLRPRPPSALPPISFLPTHLLFTSSTSPPPIPFRAPSIPNCLLLLPRLTSSLPFPQPYRPTSSSTCARPPSPRSPLPPIPDSLTSSSYYRSSTVSPRLLTTPVPSPPYRPWITAPPCLKYSHEPCHSQGPSVKRSALPPLSLLPPRLTLSSPSLLRPSPPSPSSPSLPPPLPFFSLATWTSPPSSPHCTFPSSADFRPLPPSRLLPRVLPLSLSLRRRPPLPPLSHVLPSLFSTLSPVHFPDFSAPPPPAPLLPSTTTPFFPSLRSPCRDFAPPPSPIFRLSTPLPDSRPSRPLSPLPSLLGMTSPSPTSPSPSSSLLPSLNPSSHFSYTHLFHFACFGSPPPTTTSYSQLKVIPVPFNRSLFLNILSFHFSALFSFFHLYLLLHFSPLLLLKPPFTSSPLLYFSSLLPFNSLLSLHFSPLLLLAPLSLHPSSPFISLLFSLLHISPLFFISLLFSLSISLFFLPPLLSPFHLSPSPLLSLHFSPLLPLLPLSLSPSPAS
ncbi:hypothetical protein C7M84_021176 [Penaeus vannamei]|uniref:Uncharacterized protein n=1 Tax=Penaeus vannamei TaxID=6689 RepID=A0A3R7NL12_PENVA|nr:hypothetical protein C7M84_021176 [Penaeus vannamei]